MKALIFNWFVAAGFACIILYLSSIPQEAPAEIPYIDLALHIACYTLFAVLISRAIFTRRNSVQKTHILIIIMAVTLYGGIIEVLQFYIPTRSASFTDGIANLLGAALGGIGYMKTSKKSVR